MEKCEGQKVSAFVHFEDVTKIYKTGDVEVRALSGASFEIEKGEFCVIVGESGAGKTTLLNILGGMDTLTSGRVLMDGVEISSFNRTKLENYRRFDIGFVFQFYNQIPNLTALENVEIAAQLCPEHIPADEVLRAVGLGHRMDNFPAQLSGGEQQRVSIARALAKKPKLLLCDEPTGALDYETGKSILKLLQDTCRRDGMTVVIITHNAALSAMADRIIRVKSGQIHSVRLNDHIVPVEQIEWQRGRAVNTHDENLKKEHPAQHHRQPRTLCGDSAHHHAGRGVSDRPAADPPHHDRDRDGLHTPHGAL